MGNAICGMYWWLPIADESCGRIQYECKQVPVHFWASAINCIWIQTSTAGCAVTLRWTTRFCKLNTTKVWQTLITQKLIFYELRNTAPNTTSCVNSSWCPQGQMSWLDDQKLIAQQVWSRSLPPIAKPTSNWLYLLDPFKRRQLLQDQVT